VRSKAICYTAFNLI